jgi:multidrug/hemolysin transport system ATP-binding protein
VSDEYIVTVTDAKDAISLLEALKDNIKQFEVIKGSMDDVFIEVIGSELHV